jgi:DNA mismatch repair ATPase MutS
VTLRADRHLRYSHKADFARFFDLLSDLDALCGMAEVTRERGFCFPDIVAEDRFRLDGEGLFHPFLERPVGNPVRLTGEETLFFLTGPNMAGKTTYLKTVAVCAYLAHVGMSVPARAFRISVLDALFTSLSPEDDLRRGLSFFMAEVERVREVAEAAVEGARILALFDEVFKGTNVKDALDASRRVILGFSRARASGFIFASHLTELAEDLQAQRGVRFGHFEGEVIDGRAVYDFRLTPGVSSQRLGLHLLAEAGVPDLLASLEDGETR